MYCQRTEASTSMRSEGSPSHVSERMSGEQVAEGGGSISRRPPRANKTTGGHHTRAAAAGGCSGLVSDWRCCMAAVRGRPARPTADGLLPPLALPNRMSASRPPDPPCSTWPSVSSASANPPLLPSLLLASLPPDMLASASRRARTKLPAHSMCSTAQRCWRSSQQHRLMMACWYSAGIEASMIRSCVGHTAAGAAIQHTPCRTATR